MECRPVARSNGGLSVRGPPWVTRCTFHPSVLQGVWLVRPGQEGHQRRCAGPALPGEGLGERGSQVQLLGTLCRYCWREARHSRPFALLPACPPTHIAYRAA